MKLLTRKETDQIFELYASKPNGLFLNKNSFHNAMNHLFYDEVLIKNILRKVKKIRANLDKSL